MKSLLKTASVQISVFCILFLSGNAIAGENSTNDPITARVIAVVTLEKPGNTAHILKQVDRIVPELKKISADKIIRLDCNYKGALKRESDVRAAYTAAAKIEKYLRERHKLKLDLWISARLSRGKSSNPRMVISVLSDEINQYQKLPVNSGNMTP